MRLKVYTAPTMTQAMELVRRELGDEAMIVASHGAGRSGGVRLTAAVEDRSDEPMSLPASPDHAAPDQDLRVDDVRQALVRHGTPAPIIDRLVATLPADDRLDAGTALTQACAATFRFAPVSGDGLPPRTIVVGPPGAGKTLAVAKLATRLHRRGVKVAVVSTDTRRPGGVEPLRAFARILAVELTAVATPGDLADAVRRTDRPVIIDTAGVNPFSGADMDTLLGLIEMGNAEPVLVMAAGSDPLEAIDVAQAFAPLRVRRLLSTRLDMVRRLGGLLAAADGGGFAFGEVSVSHHVSDSLVPIDAAALANLIVPFEAATAAPPMLKEAVP
jgi:flagellar biosynthesis protein FlhF